MKQLLLIAVCSFFLMTVAGLSASKQEQMSIGGDLGLALPTGDLGNSAKTGFGISASWNYFINPQLSFGVLLGYTSFGGGSGFSFSSVPLNAGIYYRFTKGGTVKPYLGLETLLYFLGISYSDGFSSGSTSETKFGFTPVFGIAFPVEKELEVRINAKYSIVMSSGSNWTYITISGGLHYFFN